VKRSVLSIYMGCTFICSCLFAVDVEEVQLSESMPSVFSPLPALGVTIAEKMTPDPVEEVQEAEEATNPFPTPKRLSLRYVQSSLGERRAHYYGTNYGTIGLLMASDYQTGSFMPMVDLRVHRLNNDKYAANAGIGGRYVPKIEGTCALWGINLFYDWREGFRGGYNQIGTGIEILGRRWDFRANGYFPVGKGHHVKKCVFDDYFGDYVAIRKRKAFDRKGYNAEIGWLAISSDIFQLYAAAGPYLLPRKCHNFVNGGKFRLRPQLGDFLALDLSVTYDSVYKAVYLAEVILYWPIYQLSQRRRPTTCGLSEQQIYQPIERIEVIPLGKRTCWKSNF
jgi:hypothetical protein